MSDTTTPTGADGLLRKAADTLQTYLDQCEREHTARADQPDLRDLIDRLAALSSVADGEAVATVCLRGEQYAHGHMIEVQLQVAPGTDLPIGTKLYTRPAAAGAGEDCRWFAGGPEGSFFAQDHADAEKLIAAAGFDRDDWTVTDLSEGDTCAAAPSPGAGGEINERKAAEQEYTMTAFDYVRDPVGSRDWTLFWKGWQARAALPATHHQEQPPC